MWSSEKSIVVWDGEAVALRAILVAAQTTQASADLLYHTLHNIARTTGAVSVAVVNQQSAVLRACERATNDADRTLFRYAMKQRHGLRFTTQQAIYQPQEARVAA